MTKLHDRNKGMFYGLAIGDALGAAVEFQAPGSFSLVVGYRGFGPHNLDPGEWTDDTSMALALADSLAGGWSSEDQLERYLAWYRDGKYSVVGRCFDIGCGTRSALNDFHRCKSLSNNPKSSGNGSVMRLAPIPIVYGHLTVKSLACRARDSSDTTHSSEYSRDCCAYLAIVLAALARGAGKVSLTRKWWAQNGVSLNQTVLDWIFDLDRHPEGKGFVLPSLHAALWAFRTGRSFEQAVLKAVNLGNDADTTGAICGQLAGAHWGFEKIPSHLVSGLAKKEMIDKYLHPILQKGRKSS